MSNQAVGGVYQQIIQDVIDSSRVDFEEGGVDEVVLEELKKGWQRKLSQLNVAAFPWDPKPDPTPANNAPPPAPLPAQQASVADYTQAQLSPPPPSVLPHPVPMAPSPSLNQNGNAGVVKAEPGSAKSDVTIKQEPGLQNGPLPQAHHAYTTAQMRGPQVPVAAQRAAQALEGQFGPRAAASISAIHSGMSQASQMNQGQGPGQQGPRPASVAPQHMNAAQQYRQQVANATAIQQQRAQQSAQASGQNGIGNSQMDGPSDAIEGVLMQRDANGNPVVLGRIEIDSMLHEHIAARAKRMEGGGLMLPLREAARHTSLPAKKRNAHGTSQLDGLDDDIKDEELDDDAINSDLDDPDDELEDEEDDDEAMGHIMLCMYDKVQRVKNKWKCTLKDGVLTVNGREYVFHKATGEYEW